MPFNPASLKNLRPFSGGAAQQSGQQPTNGRARESQPKSGLTRTRKSDEDLTAALPVESVPATENQALTPIEAAPVALAAQILANAAPDAARYLHRVVSGAVRVAPHCRITAATTILEANGLKAEAPRQAPEQSEVMLAMVGRLAQALGVRRPRDPVTVEVPAKPAE